MAKKSQQASPTVDKDYQAENDGRTLMEAQEIRNDSARHKKALACLKEKEAAACDAVAMEEKVKKGLKAAFPADKKESY
jgi:hypothetical protein